MYCYGVAVEHFQADIWIDSIPLPVRKWTYDCYSRSLSYLSSLFASLSATKRPLSLSIGHNDPPVAS